jgi:hypothetical protein
VKRSRKTTGRGSWKPQAPSRNGKAKAEQPGIRSFLALLQAASGTANQEISRYGISRWLSTELGGHDIDEECGYPENITFEMYKKFYEREGIATRVVSAMPTECWSVQPWVYETESMEEDEQTPFEIDVKELNEKLGLYKELNNVDEIAGIGWYGILFLGFSDKKSPERPVQGIDENGKMIEGNFPKINLLYVTAYTQGQARIDTFNKNQDSDRFGMPLFYNITISDPNDPYYNSGKEVKVHWSRVIHVPINCKSGKVFGTPRMRPVFNYLINCRKILGGTTRDCRSARL